MRLILTALSLSLAFLTVTANAATVCQKANMRLMRGTYEGVCEFSQKETGATVADTKVQAKSIPYTDIKITANGKGGLNVSTNPQIVLRISPTKEDLQTQVLTASTCDLGKMKVAIAGQTTEWTETLNIKFTLNTLNFQITGTTGENNTDTTTCKLQRVRR
jgi:hypothetical protein